VAYDVDSRVEATTQPFAQSPLVSRTDHQSPDSPRLESLENNKDETPASPTLRPMADTPIQDVPRTSSLSESVAPMATPKETQHVWSEGTFVFTEDPALTPSLIQCLQDHRLLETIHEYSRVCYAKDTRGYQPLTERVLTDAIGCLEDSLKDTEKLLNEEREARRLAEDLLANAELLVKVHAWGHHLRGSLWRQTSS
jgi:hypothetical protein